MGRHRPGNGHAPAQGRDPPAGRDRVRRRAGVPAKKNGGHNGWITALAEWACRTYGWTWREAVFEVPASVLALYWRQSRRASGEENVMHLSEIEKIDDAKARTRLTTERTND